MRHRPRERPGLALFCLAAAGGGAAPFRGWHAHLPEEIDVCAVRLPGRENRIYEEPVAEMPRLVQALADGIADELRALPFAIYGQCTGALVGFELARELRRRGLPAPVHLLAADQDAPSRTVPEAEPGATLSQDELVERVRRFGATDQIFLGDPELFAAIEPALRADFALGDGYRYSEEPPLETPITVLARREAELAPALTDWRAETTGTFTLRVLPAEKLLDAEAWPAIVAAVAAELRGPALERAAAVAGG